MTNPIPVSTPQTCHRSVADMVSNLLADEPDLVTELKTRLATRQLVKSLAIIRARAGLSQKELATKLRCTQSKISKIESGVDADLRFGDVDAYLQSTAHEAKIFVVPGGGTLVDEVKMHAFQIKHLLDRMVELAGTDGAITVGVAEFIEEAANNLARFTKMAGKALPKLPPEPNRSVQVETPELEGAEDSLPPRSAHRRKTTVGAKSARATVGARTDC